MTDGEDCSLLKALEPYLGSRLSAYDNAKLIYSVLSNMGVDVTAHEAMFCFAEQAQKKPIYCLHSHGRWINCGITNSYAAQISLISADDVKRLSAVQELVLPVLGEQQLAALMMQYAHFDHC